ncbi:MAG: pseudouridine synthase, partial [Deltaproteobacteria bacterium]|nr:pseudouridine synthase [Deltaproteobacteria bacterium]
MKKISIKKTINNEDHDNICDFLVEMSGLSKIRVKGAMQKGALHVKRDKGPFKRVRRAKSRLVKGQRIEFYYDETLLAIEPLQASLLYDLTDFSAWFKPPGMLTQGTKYGDHCSLIRFIEHFFKPSREVYPLHRLDREASGIVLAAHNKKAASKLSYLFRKNAIGKSYKIEVAGRPENEGIIDSPLDGKKALTSYQVIDNDNEKGTSTLLVTIETGRFHQIRRHFNGIGHPVM